MPKRLRRRDSDFRQRGEGVDVGDNIDNDRPVDLERLLQSTGKLGRILHTDAHGTHVVGDGRKARSSR